MKYILNITYRFKLIVFLIFLLLVSINTARSEEGNTNTPPVDDEMESIISELVTEDMKLISINKYSSFFKVRIEFQTFTDIERFQKDVEAHPHFAKPIVLGGEDGPPIKGILKIPIIINGKDKASFKKIRLEENNYGEIERQLCKKFKMLIAALEMFRSDNEFYPSTEQGLDALIRKPQVGMIPDNWNLKRYLFDTSCLKDIWGNPFVYISPVTYGSYDIISFGLDNKPGGEENSRDISSWEIERLCITK